MLNLFGKLFANFASPKKLREAGILGMNRRNFNVISKYNKRRLYPLVDDKVQTKILANKIGINTPGLIGVIEYQHEVKNILEIVKGYKEFVVKPAHGSGEGGWLRPRGSPAGADSGEAGGDLGLCGSHRRGGEGAVPLSLE